ncbi:hypothetical protein M011DRAFT_500886 [Sporormia fimetaria CBS 119925]|uniref:Uncharacterized protein n=1 Tax=Sporormia fimetaria CBS 119925 TaxID=1340428 RepID=A0A6A6V8T1_9PLEO|nr:hypothetical protein M011DRAFT_500886 [Sporormia fimetaria CBS 119925]
MAARNARVLVSQLITTLQNAQGTRRVNVGYASTTEAARRVTGFPIQGIQDHFVSVVQRDFTYNRLPQHCTEVIMTEIAHESGADPRYHYTVVEQDSNGDHIQTVQLVWDNRPTTTALISAGHHPNQQTAHTHTAWSNVTYPNQGYPNQQGQQQQQQRQQAHGYYPNQQAQQQQAQQQQAQGYYDQWNRWIPYQK